MVFILQFNRSLFKIQNSNSKFPELAIDIPRADMVDYPLFLLGDVVHSNGEGAIEPGGDIHSSEN